MSVLKSYRQWAAMKRSAHLLLCLALGLQVAAHAQPKDVPQPSPNLMPNVALGKKLYEKNCASCHGQDLKGSDKGPAFLHPVYVPSHHGDAAFQMAAKYGVTAHHWRLGNMPPITSVTPDDVKHITAYIRQTQRQFGIE